MKTLTRILPIVAFMILSQFPFPAGAQDDVKYLGEVCCHLDEGIVLGTPSPVMRIGILSFGAGYFVLSGVHAGILPINGTAFIGENNTIVISLYYSFNSGGSSVSLFSAFYMLVDATTLQGKYTEMHVQTTPEPPSISTFRGSVSLSLCN